MTEAIRPNVAAARAPGRVLMSGSAPARRRAAHPRGGPIAERFGRRILDVDGRTVIFEITIAEVPVPRPFLSYRFFQDGQQVDGVLAEVKGYPASVCEQFRDDELTCLFRAARRGVENERRSSSHRTLPPGRDRNIDGDMDAT